MLFGFVLGEVSKCHKQELQKQWGYQKVSAPNFSCGTAQTNNTLFVSAQRYYFCTFQTVYGLYKLRWFKWRKRLNTFHFWYFSIYNFGTMQLGSLYFGWVCVSTAVSIALRQTNAQHRSIGADWWNGALDFSTCECFSPLKSEFVNDDDIRFLNGALG